MKLKENRFENICCIIAAAIFLAPAVYILARELMGY